MISFGMMLCILCNPQPYYPHREPLMDDYLIETISGVSQILHEPVRLRLVMKDADLFAIQFHD